MNKFGDYGARHQTGFTLLEAVVALLIMSMGLLSIIGLQSQAMDNSVQAARLTRADMAAQDIANRIRANPHPQAAPIYSKISTQRPPSSARDCRQNHCNPADMARFDASQWLAMLEQASPGLSGLTRCLQVSQHTGCQRYQVILFWPAGSRQPSNDPKCAQTIFRITDPTNLACHSFEFEP